MSFAANTRDELAHLPMEDAQAMCAEAAGMLQAGGIMTLSGRGLCVSLEREQASIARRAYSLLKEGMGLSPTIHTRQGQTLGRAPLYVVQLKGDQAQAALDQAGLADLGLSNHVPAAYMTRKKNRRAFLRGAFLTSGTLGDPSKGYHMEWRLARARTAQVLLGMLKRDGIQARISSRREDFVLYLKDSERIADALALMGAVTALLDMENTRVLKGLRNLVNRQVNCESANVDKTTLAAQRQIGAIRLLEEQGRLKRLSKALRETAELRIENPEATLEELGALHLAPLGKSGINHRLRRLQTLSEEPAPHIIRQKAT